MIESLLRARVVRTAGTLNGDNPRLDGDLDCDWRQFVSPASCLDSVAGAQKQSWLLTTLGDGQRLGAVDVLHFESIGTVS